METRTRTSYNQNKRQFRIPGYSGYIPGFYSENLYGSTFGNMTTDVNLNRSFIQPSKKENPMIDTNINIRIPG
jgi:hypothetical protein